MQGKSSKEYDWNIIFDNQFWNYTELVQYPNWVFIQADNEINWPRCSILLLIHLDCLNRDSVKGISIDGGKKVCVSCLEPCPLIYTQMYDFLRHK